MTARLTTCNDLTKNEADLKKIGDLFAALQASATPLALLLSWFPGLARKLGKAATTEFFVMIRTYVEARRHAEPTSDPIDILIADGETTDAIVEVNFFPKITGDVTSNFTALVCDDDTFCWCYQHRHHRWVSPFEAVHAPLTSRKSMLDAYRSRDPSRVERGLQDRDQGFTYPSPRKHPFLRNASGKTRSHPPFSVGRRTPYPRCLHPGITANFPDYGTPPKEPW